MALANSSYASTLLEHAQQLYNFATNSSIPQCTYQTSVPTAGQAYASSDFSDDLAIAGLFLALAGNSTDLYKQAVQVYQKQGLVGRLQGGTVFNWDEKTPGVVVLGAQIAKTYPELARGAQQDWAADAEAFFDNIVNGSSRAYVTSGIYIELLHVNDDCSLLCF